MSRVVSMIKATDTGRRTFTKVPLSKVFSINEVFEKPYSSETFTYNIHYRIGIDFGSQVIVPSDSPDRLQHAIKSTKRSVIEYIFGEFRPYFRELNMALWEHDISTAQEIVERFEKQMYEEDSFE